MVMTDEIAKSISRAFEASGPRHGLVAAYLYGSHVRGEARPGSDIDIAVLVESQKSGSSLDLLRLGQDLEKATGFANIDVRLLNDAPLSARGKILSEGRLLYSGNERVRVDFEVSTRSSYFDFLPHLTYLREAFVKRIAESGL